MSKLPITVIMLSLNEEFHLPGVIENLEDWAEEIFLVDSCSTDRTVDIALEHGVRIVQRPFTNFGDQWNSALEKLPIKTPWTLKIDPDERVSPTLVHELRELLEGQPQHTGYSMRRRLWFMGKPLHVTSWVLRLWRTGSCHFSDVIVNEHPIVSGSMGKLRGIMEHLDSPDLHHWYEKQNRYSTMEAIMRVKGDPLAAKPRLLGSSLDRRMWLKKVFYSLPFRYRLQWLYEAFVRGAIWDVSIGRNWIHLRIEVMRAVELKVREMRMTGQIPEIPKAPHGEFDPRILTSSLRKTVMEAAGRTP
jgi:glycosyltransferase involved in cell wall biosynthesis